MTVPSSWNKTQISLIHTKIISYLDAWVMRSQARNKAENLTPPLKKSDSL